MTRAILFLARDAADSPEQFQQAGVDGLRRHAADEALTSLRVGLVEPPPADRPYRPANDVELGALALVALIVDFSADSAGDLERIANRLATSAGAESWFGYLVDETVEKQEHLTTVGSESPGLTYLALVTFHADLPESAGRRSWANHVPLALMVHASASSYIRNWIVGTLGDAPTATGITVLTFENRDDLLQRFFDSPRGAMEIAQDTAHFLSAGRRFYLRELPLL